MFRNAYLLFFLFLSFFSSAENSKTQAGFEVHYNVFNSLSLSREVANSYQITRSANRGFLNISILKQQKDSVALPVEARILLKAKNLFGQSKNVELKKIAENDGAIYYVSTFSVSHREVINFNAKVTPKDSNQVIEIKFSQEFFTD